MGIYPCSDARVPGAELIRVSDWYSEVYVVTFALNHTNTCFN